MGLSDEGVPCFCHVFNLKLGLGDDNSSDIVRLAVSDDALVLAYSDGRIVLCNWDGPEGDSTRFAKEIPKRCVWRLPSECGSPTALVQGGSSVGGLVFAGTERGRIAVFKLHEEKVHKVATSHAPNAISAMLLSPEIVKLGAEAPAAKGLHLDMNLCCALFSGDSAGRIQRTWFCANFQANATGIAPHPELESELVAELASPVLALEICEQSGRLLISTAARVAVIDGVLSPEPLDAAEESKVRWIGSRPHRGELTATFIPMFGPERLIAARPGGRLWVAEASSGQVHTTLKFQGAGSEDKAVLGRLMLLNNGKVLSWSRTGTGIGDDVTDNSAITLLDLKTIAVCREWSMPPVTDAAFTGVTSVLLAHRHTVSVLVLYDSPMLMLRALLHDGMHRLTQGAGCLLDLVGEVSRLRSVVGSQASARELVECLQPLITAVVAQTKEYDLNKSFPAGMEGIEPFMHWVSELEEREVVECQGICDVARSLMVSPLANFPVAEGVGNVALPVIAMMRQQKHNSELLEPMVSPDHCCVFEGRKRHHGFGVSGESMILKPEILQQCQQAAQQPHVQKGKSGHKSDTAGPTIKALFMAAPKADGSVLRALQVTPFSSTPAVLQYFKTTSEWLVSVLVLIAHDTFDPAWEQLCCPSALFFELMCLHSVFIAHHGCCSAWPRLGFLPKEIGSDAPLIQSDELAVHSLSSVIRAVCEAIREPDISCEEREHENQPQEPWATCALTWTPAVALAFCNILLGHPSVPRLCMERCLFRANGLAPLGRGWPLVVEWLRSRLQPVLVVPMCDLSEWEQLLTQLERTLHGMDSGAGTADTHAVLLSALGSEAIIGKGGMGCDSRRLTLLQRAFRLALAHFPRVLPWNVDLWTQQLVNEASAGLGTAVPRMQQSEAVQEIVLGEFLHYLLRLLPACSGCSDFVHLLESVVAIALHRQQNFPDNLQLHCRRNAVADTLVDRYRAHLSVEHLCRLQYPLGVIQLLARCPGTRDENPDAVRVLPKDQFGVIIDLVVKIVAEARTPAHHTTAYGWFGRHSSDAEELMRCDTTAARAASHGDAKFPALKSTGDLHQTCSNNIRAIPHGFLELAQCLHQLCSERLERWAYVLETTAGALTAPSSHKTDDGDGPIRSSPAWSANVQWLLAALATVRPGHETAAVCVRAAASGALAGATAEAAAYALWAESNHQQLSHNAMDLAKACETHIHDGSAKGLLQKPATPRVCEWLCLPQQHPPVVSPVIIRRQYEHPVATESERLWACGCEYVSVSADGLYARHLDDTGELMHGVVLSSKPLECGRAGLYFEVELVENRLEEAPDGLTIGVTATEPAAICAVPQTAERIPQTWVVGYDGQMWDPEATMLSQVEWDPRTLCEGDVIGVLVTSSEGELLVFHNGVACCPGPRGIPVGSKPLFAVVDILGAARAIRWRTCVEPPIGNSN